MIKKLTCIFLTLLMLVPLLSFAATATSQSTDTPAPTADDITLDDIVKAAAGIVRENEGSYSSVNANDNGALSIGWIQWHAGRALSLLKTIVSADTPAAIQILGDTLCNEIITATNWSSRALNADEAKKVSALISTEIGMKAQDDLAAQDLSSYVNRAIGYGINDPSALVYYADIENQCGSGGAKKVAQAAAVLAGSYADVDLEIIYKAALSDPVAGKYATRRQKTYNNCLLLDWTIIGTDLEVWNIKSARNVRRTADPTSELVTGISSGTKVIISEKAYVGSQTRGKTSMGWITLDPESCELNTSLSGGTVPAPLIFDAAGGTFGDDPVAEHTLNGINTPRSSNSLVLYNGDYPKSAPQTNAYGAEVAVDASGIVLTNPKYGTCKTEIPKGGFVLSAIGSAYTWLSASIKAGNYVYFDSERSAIYVYTSYNAYAQTVKATKSVIGVNTSRPANSVVIYNGDYSYSAPQTNAYGGEAAVDKSGKVISAPKYGTCKTQIPDGGFVISGIGTGYTWLSSSVKVGDYVFFDPATGTLSVYSDRDRYLSQSKSTHASAIYGDLPIPSKPGTEFLGWYISGTDTRVTKDTVCTSAFTVILRASWDKFNGHTVGYNAQGGSFTGIASTTVNGINVSRPANSVVIYDSSLGLSAPQTNEFGCEIAVDKNGAVLSVPKYGTCKTTIPNGGFVISTIGTGFTWLSQNVKEGCYADFNKKTGILTIYKDKTTYDAHCKEILPGKPIGAFPEVTRQYHKLVGWYNQNGTKVTEATLMPAGGLSLFAKWEVLPGALSFNADGGSVCGLISSAKLTGENVTRTSGALILYRDKASTGTNIYGSEAVITSDGTVCAVYPYGRGNAAIPEGCFVLSGNGAMSSWIQNNLKAGYHVTLEGGTVSVWADKNAYNAKATTTVKYGEKYGILPTATKEGYVFCGWKDKNGTVVTEGATVSLYGDVTLTAVWEKLCTVTFDPAGGTVVSGGEAVKLSGINVSRGSNALVMYAGGASTRTNVYGSEAVVKFDGTVVSVYPYGRGNTAIPAGCFVLSGNGTMSTWIQKNLKAGGYVTVKGFNITAYESYAAYDAADGKLLVRKGSPMGGEASAFFKNKALNGWYLKDALYTKSSVITSDVTLTAGWTIVSAQASFNTAGGAFHPPVSTVTANAVNTSRPSNSLVIYDAGYKNAYPLTNPYGTEVAVDANGIVLSSPVYGACKTPIPEGGFVISGVGTGYKWLLQNVSAGCYIHRDGDSAVITVYRSYGDYLYTLGKTLNLNQPYGTLPTPTRDGYIFCGWTDSRGNAVTESTIVTSCDDPTLTATWKAILSISLDPDGGSISSPAATISGINVSRGSNSLVLYRDKASTGTNIYGTEAVADKDGRIIELRYYGKGNASIPEGGFVLSAHGTMADWVRANISVGYYIGISDTTVTVYKTELSRAAATKSPVTVYEGTKVEGLPTPVKHGYKFLGWFCGNAQLREGDKISASAAYTASWAPVEMTVTLDAADGYFAPVAVCTANGVNVQRGSNQLIIYNGADGRTTTGTNVYGTEIVVNAAGAVVEVRTYGKGNAAIPKGGYVISAHGSAAAALPTTIAAGDSVTVKDLKITIYKKGVSRQNAVITGRYSYPLGALPTPRRDGYSFVGWHTTDGILITEKTPVTFATANFTLYAHWEKTK